jgi:hypothetical protein
MPGARRFVPGRAAQTTIPALAALSVSAPACRSSHSTRLQVTNFLVQCPTANAAANLNKSSLPPRKRGPRAAIRIRTQTRTIALGALATIMLGLGTSARWSELKTISIIPTVLVTALSTFSAFVDARTRARPAYASCAPEPSNRAGPATSASSTATLHSLGRPFFVSAAAISLACFASSAINVA